MERTDFDEGADEEGGRLCRGRLVGILEVMHRAIYVLLGARWWVCRCPWWVRDAGRGEGRGW